MQFKIQKSINNFPLYFIQAIRHEKLDQPQTPCEHSNDYNFARCVLSKV